MTPEEKAKAYDKALERAKKWYNEEEPDSYTCIVESIFPELQKDEDEEPQENKNKRIRKALISILKSDFEKDTTIFDISVGEIIAWLEKQGKKELALKSSKHEDVRKFEQYIEEQAKVFNLNLSNKGYNIYAFAENILHWLENQSKYETIWKPTKEQLEALEHFVRSVGESGYASPYDNNTKLLYSLLTDLQVLEKQ